MCKRNCIYNNRDIHSKDAEYTDKPCSWCLTPESMAESRTRTGTLMKQYGLPKDHPKIRHLLKGENCPFFRPKASGAEPKPKPRPMPVKVKRIFQPAPEEDLLRLYHEGLSDRNVALKLGTTEDKVRRWRNQRGLEPNRKSIKKIDDERVYEMYMAGISDRKIAAEIGVQACRIQNWREARNLPTKQPMPKKKKKERKYE